MGFCGVPVGDNVGVILRITHLGNAVGGGMGQPLRAYPRKASLKVVGRAFGLI